MVRSPRRSDPGEAAGHPPDAGVAPAPASVDLAPTRVVASDGRLPRPPRLGSTAKGLPLLAIEDPQGSLSRLYRRLAAIELFQFVFSA